MPYSGTFLKLGLLVFALGVILFLKNGWSDETGPALGIGAVCLGIGIRGFLKKDDES